MPIKTNEPLSFFLPRNFQVTSQTYQTIPNFPWLRYTLRVERSKAIKAYVVSVGIVNCELKIISIHYNNSDSGWFCFCYHPGFTAAAFLTISVATLVYRPRKIYSEIVLVPVAFLFALPAMRSTFPGSPSVFGEFCICISLLSRS